MAGEKRETLLSEIERVFADANPSDTGGGTTWGRVLSSPIEGREFRGQNVMAILEGTETYTEPTSPDKLERRLEVDLQTRVYVPRGVELRQGANTVLADVEELIYANNLWNGNAVATRILANTVEREDTGDRTVEVTVFMAVQYRTKRTDPRS